MSDKIYPSGSWNAGLRLTPVETGDPSMTIYIYLHIWIGTSWWSCCTSIHWLHHCSYKKCGFQSLSTVCVQNNTSACMLETLRRDVLLQKQDVGKGPAATSFHHHISNKDGEKHGLRCDIYKIRCQQTKAEHLTETLFCQQKQSRRRHYFTRRVVKTVGCCFDLEDRFLAKLKLWEWMSETCMPRNGSHFKAPAGTTNQFTLHSHQVSVSGLNAPISACNVNSSRFWKSGLNQWFYRPTTRVSAFCSTSAGGTTSSRGKCVLFHFYSTSVPDLPRVGVFCSASVPLHCDFCWE